MKLPKGVTGFHTAGEAVFPLTDMTAFKADCYEYARRGGGIVSRLPWEEAPLSRSFAIFGGEWNSVPSWILINTTRPIVAVARPRDLHLCGPLEFFDHQPALDYFRTIGCYEVLDRSELEGAVREEDLEQLGPAERRQISHWKPQRVGDIIFNYWD